MTLNLKAERPPWASTKVRVGDSVQILEITFNGRKSAREAGQQDTAARIVGQKATVIRVDIGGVSNLGEKGWDMEVVLDDKSIKGRWFFYFDQVTVL